MAAAGAEDEDTNVPSLEAVTAADAAASKNKDTATDVKSSKAEPASTGLIHTLFLAVPLMLKFVVVLVIKFLTDLVVFPLLFAYRLARLTKRKILGLFGVKTRSNSSSGDNSNKSTNGTNKLDDFHPNGSGNPSGLAP